MLQLPILLRPDNKDLVRIQGAVNLVNQLQLHFRFELEHARWLPKEGPSAAPLADVSFRRDVGSRDGRRPLIVLTSVPLRGSYFAFEHRDISVISTADWEDKFAPPPLKIYLAYQLAYIGLIVAADLPDSQVQLTFHKPKGCLFDESEDRDEFRIGLIGAHLCAECEGFLAEMSTPDSAIEATCEILSYVRAATIRKPRVPPTHIFIGHGKADDWKQLRDFLQGDLRLSAEEFNSDPAAGWYTGERVLDMIDRARLAFLVMTGDDVHEDGTSHARENLIHEIGLCQGRFGLKRAIIVKDERAQEFSNVHGITYIPFRSGEMHGAFAEITRTLLREGLVDTAVAEVVLQRVSA